MSSGAWTQWQKATKVLVWSAIVCAFSFLGAIWLIEWVG